MRCYNCREVLREQGNTFVSQRFQFIYIRQPKSGSTAIERAMSRTICGTALLKECSTTALAKLHDATSSDETKQRWWRSFFVFTFVRNPCDTAALLR